MSDDLGDRLKAYEGAYMPRAMPLLPILARIDGKAFHALTRRFQKPFDVRLHRAFVETTRHLVRESAALVGYTQSDEITLAWYTDSPGTQLFFDGKIQKMVSVLASMATSIFAEATWDDFGQDAAPLHALFDCRVWQVPTLEEAANVFVWREIDATKNSVAMAARHYYSHKQLLNMGRADMMDLLMAKGVNWNDYPNGFKRGTHVRRTTVRARLTDAQWEKIPAEHRGPRDAEVERSVVRVEEDFPPILSIDNRVGVLFRGEDPDMFTAVARSRCV